MLSEILDDLVILQLIKHVKLLGCRNTLVVTMDYQPNLPLYSLGVMKLFMLFNEVFAFTLFYQPLTEANDLVSDRGAYMPLLQFQMQLVHLLRKFFLLVY